jgi:GTP-binding protein
MTVMKIKEAVYELSAVKFDQYPQNGLPEIALVGRSNVGKSSLINKLINRKNLARTSSQPGKTRTQNFYRINELFYLVDLPGYGYAKASQDLRRQWGKMIEKYLLERKELQGVIQLIDIRHPPTEDDCYMQDWLAHHNFHRIVVATKADKISRGNRQKHLAVIKKELPLKPEVPLILFSAENGDGTEDVHRWLEKTLTIVVDN